METFKAEKRVATKRGFTMIELVFVIILIAVIAAFTIPKIMDNSEKTQISGVLGSDMKSIFQAAGQWKKSSSNSDGTYANLTNTEIESYLPSNMKYDSVNDLIESSGYDGAIHYKIISDKVANNGDSFKLFIDGSGANSNNNWSNNVIKSFERTAMDLAVKNSTDIATTNTGKTGDATDLGGANATFTTGGTTTDAQCGVRFEIF